MQWLNALRSSGHEREGVDQLAALAGLDMADWWKADSSFFQRLSKADIQKAIQETAGSVPRGRYDQLGKSDLAKFAEKTASGWLPRVFRKERAPIAEAAEQARADATPALSVSSCLIATGCRDRTTSEHPV
jgi:hypothetical protein